MSYDAFESEPDQILAMLKRALDTGSLTNHWLKPSSIKGLMSSEWSRREINDIKDVEELVSLVQLYQLPTPTQGKKKYPTLDCLDN